MIEEIIQNYLRENAFPCYLSVPEKPSGNFCILEKTGDSPDEGIYTATLAAQSSGRSVWLRPEWMNKILPKCPTTSVSGKICGAELS